ncbi:MAG: type II toxin-antitoxin system tRNA(fMet)-specific endonuclease VapC [Desulfurivibrionaceae bacterium]|jgi:tRNA(fMet)-specific endonuclease VapC|nr:type II toxin-antitoxin system VapC family toxin [Pseudomonadota bacterium]MBU4411555.1 type II toxin-antitoxin system VapC family toxin [Pseudomonadota bacterium]MCG2823681.1 type II toxin-antitoxin system VapC family toxin [Desulfobulbaceae bacterium]MDP2758763.1 type II toxin-antitoxin system VapC family toxin [Desulfurivibrionaceae bacterium]
MHYLFDTNICIYLIKKRPPEALAQFKRHSPLDVAISTITLFELEYGVEKSQYRQRSQDALAKFLLPFNLLELDRSAATDAAAIRAELEKKGLPIGPYDLLIAGLARSQNMTLVTNNTKEFERVDGLRLENWVQ